MLNAGTVLQVLPDKGIDNQINTQKPLEQKLCTVNSDGIVMTENSRLRYAVPGAELAKSGTLLMEISPDSVWMKSRLSAPQILFQMGGAHWVKNNLTVLREASPMLLVRMHDAANKQSFYATDSRTLKNGNMFIGFSWNKSEALLYINGRRIHSWKNPTLPEILPDYVNIGSPSNGKKDWSAWSFKGTVRSCVIMTDSLNGKELSQKTFLDNRLKPLTQDVPYLETSGQIVQIGNEKVELQIDKNGQPLGLYDKTTGKFLNDDWNGNLWGIRLDKSSIKQSSCKVRFEICKNGTEKIGVWTYEFPNKKGYFKAIINAEKDGALKFNYEIKNNAETPLMYIYYPEINGIKKSPDG